MSDLSLSGLIQDELQRAAPAAVTQLAALLAARAGGATAAVLFYGSNLRDDSLDGVLDFYLLLDQISAWPNSAPARWASRLLPPHVGYFEGAIDGRTLRAKYAVMSVAQFRARLSMDALDTTLWARFSQPCICAYARTPGDREALVEAVQRAVLSGARWAAELGPERGRAADFWRALYARTYVAELRVERSGRSRDLVARDEKRYARVLPLAWAASQLPFDVSAEGALAPRLTAAERDSAVRRWRLRQRLGKPLNVLRLMKAAFTFEGAMDYVAWKVERHAGVKLDVTPWQRRHPLLAAPGLYWKLRKLGVLR